MAHAEPTQFRNRLASETSPYLLQHATNPVDWYPWGNEALDKARAEHKPILLSIGYSACHWCHVMAHESFEDPATALIMNRLFINIKVDREERPDLDRIYQLAHQMLTQRGGGWPLTMFLTPDDQRPFFGGTYFPDQPRYGMPAFAELLTKVAEYFKDHGNEIRQQNDGLMQAFADHHDPATNGSIALNDGPLRSARTQLGEQFDKRYGGFGGAPKFPHPSYIERLLRHWHGTAHRPEPDLQALYMAALTLKRMAEGGLNDQLSGGFARYSVDEWWMIPHFEKMLYDNAALLACYAEAAIATGDLLFAEVTRRTADWLMSAMQAPEGGYYSSYDADSEGHEGKYYVWDRAELAQLLSADEYAAFAPRFGLDRDPNFENQHWHLHCFVDLAQIASTQQLPLTEVNALLESARAKLLVVRAARVPPGLDDKILTSWNALAIRGMARAARALQADRAVRERILNSACAALDYLHAQLWRHGRLLATARGGRAQHAAYLDDYAYLLDAILSLLAERWDSRYLQFAGELADVLLTQFSAAEGGFYFTAADHEQLIHRSRNFTDDATPNGNGVAALALQRLGFLLGETRYLSAAEATLKAAWGGLNRAPYAHASLLNALEEYLVPPEILILRGDSNALEHWRAQYFPQ